ncbi:MAG: NAD(P)/FAD-dependent oxidoreductase [Alphaproteobacteria bacterium]|nr:NAD(P)/FAD-dependent oxidoreductase [Alphaproteobacteria bacterium]
MTGQPDDPYDVLVIGGGLAGLTAARRAAERGLSVASLDEGGHMGGLVMNVGRIDGYPAPEPVSGIDLAAAQLEALVEHGVEIVPEAASSLAVEGDIKTVTTDGGIHAAKSVVLASGARLKSLGVPGEEALFGRGVSQCADCDAGFFVDQHVVVVGGGDSALQEALHLTEYVRAVTLVTRSDALRAKPDYVARATDNPKFSFRYASEVTEIMGSDGVEGVRVAPVGGGDAEDIACSGVFVFVGLEPNIGYLPPEIERDADGYVVTNADYQTSVPGIYAVGAVRAGYTGQLADAVAEAAAAVDTIKAG